MIFPLFKTAAVRLLRFLHARLAPFDFLLRLSLLSLLLRLAASPTLHSCLVRATTSLQTFYRLHLRHDNFNTALFLKAFPSHWLLFLLANIIILFLFFTSRRSSAQALYPAFMDSLKDTDDHDAHDDQSAHKPSNNALPIHIHPSELSIPSSHLPIPSAPPIELDNSYRACSLHLPSYNEPLYMELYRSHNEKPCNTLAIASSSKSMVNNHEVQIVPLIGPISHENVKHKSLVTSRSHTQATQHENANPKTLMRHTQDSKQIVAKQYKYYGHSVCYTYYEYAREEAYSTATLYRGSTTDNLNKEGLNNILVNSQLAIGQK